MKKGRKPKGTKKLQNLERDLLMTIENSKKKNYQENSREYDLFENFRRMNMGNQNTSQIADSENLSMEDKSELRGYAKKQSERSSQDGNSISQNQGPITRRKEHQLTQRNIYDRSVSELNSLKKFDEFYKERKNVEHEMYLYRQPRISKEVYQVSVHTIPPIDINKNCYNSEKININAEGVRCKVLNGEQLVFDYTKISKDDLNYYLKFVNYYQENSSNAIPGNIFLKGVHLIEENALKLLKDCNYDINLALRKILFPVMDLIESNEDEEKLNANLDSSIYVNSALNDLIGSNIQEKEEWLEYVKKRIEDGIDYSELQTLIEVGGKMKIDIPDFVVTEIENSINFARSVRRHLNEKNSLNDIIYLLEKSKEFNVKTEETNQLEEIIKKANNWISRVQELEVKTINYKVLQGLYQEGRNLPVLLDKFDSIKSRYLKAQKWQEKFQNLPKHSKTRQQGISNRKGNSAQERCTLQHLESMINEADEINFTSNDVVTLKSNFDKLKETHLKITAILNDKSIPKTKELLTDFINTFDSLKFATDVYDSISSKLEYFNWEEKKEYYMGSGKAVKVKHLRNLLREAEQKNITSVPEIEDFKKTFEKIESWIEKLSNVFEEGEPGENGNNPEGLSDREEENVEIMNSDFLSKKQKHKIDKNQFLQLFEEGKALEIKTEEVSKLLIKCESFYFFLEKCRNILKRCHEDVDKLGQDNCVNEFFELKQLSGIGQKFNIKCEEADRIEIEIENVRIWVNAFLEFEKEYTNVLSTEDNPRVINPNFPDFSFKELKSLDDRKKVISSLENYLDRCPVFYENLVSVMKTAPNFVKLSMEYLKLSEIKNKAEQHMKETFLTGFDHLKFESKEKENSMTNSNADQVKTDSEYAYFPEQMELKTLENFIDLSHTFAVSKDFFSQLISIYRTKSWAHIANLKKKMYITDAEAMLKESSYLSLDNSELMSIMNNITKTKEWIKQSKKIANSNEKMPLANFFKFVEEGMNLPLKSKEQNELIEFKANLDEDITSARNFLQSYQNYNDLLDLAYKVSNMIIEVPEFEIILELKNLCEEWKVVALDILNSRPLCQLYFKQDYERIIEMKGQASQIGMVEYSSNKTQTPSKKKKTTSINNLNTPSSYINDDISYSPSTPTITNQSEILPNKIENTNINIISNNYYFPLTNNSTHTYQNEVNSSPMILSKKHSKKNSKKDFDNVIQIINNIPANKNTTNSAYPSYKNSTNPYAHSNYPFPDKINMKKFNKFSHEEKMMIISQSVVLREENPDEKYCICRKGDDSVNFMIMCEGCKEWFHGKCMKISQISADKISQYICVSCSKRKDSTNQTASYHSEFYETPRVSYENFLYILEEGEKLPVFIEELNLLKNLKMKIEDWFERYEATMQRLAEFITLNAHNHKQPLCNFKIFDETLEKELIDLHIESEGLPVHLPCSINIITVLKQGDWFKEASKCIENRKFSEKANRKILISSYVLFNEEFIKTQFDNEKLLFKLILDRGLKIVSEIYRYYNKYASIISDLKNNYDKTFLEIFEELIPQIDHSDNSGLGSTQITECLSNFADWMIHFRQTMTSLDKFKSEIQDLIEKSRTFHFRYSFLDRFKRISMNNSATKDQLYDYYTDLMNEEFAKWFKNENSARKNKSKNQGKNKGELLQNTEIYNDNFN